MKKNRVIIFDFDGVIVNSVQLSLEINRQVIVDLELSDLQEWAEGNIYDNRKLKGGHVSEKMTEFYFEQYNQKVIELMPVEGLEEVLKKLNSMGYLLIINSGSSLEGINVFLKKYGLKKYFSEILAKNIHASKVEKFKMIFEKYGIKAGETLIVTDTVGDVKEAKEVGMKSIGSSWGLHEPERLIKNGVDFMAEKPEDILVGIKKILVLN